MKEVWIVIETTEIWIPSEPDDDGYYDDYYDRYEYSDKVIGVFSNEAGLGSSVIAHSASETKEPVKQGLWGIFEVFFDTIIVCTFTSLIILSSTLKAPNFYDALKNIGKDEITVCIDQNLVNEKVLKVFYFMVDLVDQVHNYLDYL